MSWLNRLIPRRRQYGGLDPEVRESLARWHSLPPPDLDRPHAETRYVVINTRASTLDPGQAELQSVAAIAVGAMRIDPRASFQTTLDDAPQPRLADLLGFVGAGPVIVFNAELNRRLIEQSLREHLGVQPDWLWIDLYWLLPALFGEVHAKPARLASWMSALDIAPFQRYHALGDAWAIARLLLAAQSRSLNEQRRTPRSLADLEESLRILAVR